MQQLIIFDFDGTLADTLGDIASALSGARVELGGAPCGPREVRSWIGEGLDHLIQEALPAGVAHVELKNLYKTHYERVMFDTSKLYDGVDAMLDRLSGHPLAVASNKTASFVTQMLEHFGMLGRFEAVIGGDSLPVKKPSPEVIKHLVAGRSFTQVWMVGDSAVDVHTGRAYGATTIGCSYGIRGRAELEAAGADHLVEHPREISDAILGR